MIIQTGTFATESDFNIIKKFTKETLNEDEYLRASTVARNHDMELEAINQRDLCNCFALEYELVPVVLGYMIMPNMEFIYEGN